MYRVIQNSSTIIKLGGSFGVENVNKVFKNSSPCPSYDVFTFMPLYCGNNSF